MIEIDAEKVERAVDLLKDVKYGSSRAIYNAINRGLSSARTKSTTYIRQDYNIKSANVKENINTKISKATASNMVGQINFSGYNIPLIKFKVTPFTPKKGLVKAGVKKGTKTVITHAYVADLGRGVGVFERQTKARNSSKELYGPSVPTMLGNENVYEQLERSTEEVVNKRLDHEIERILNGYGVS